MSREYVENPLNNKSKQTKIMVKFEEICKALENVQNATGLQNKIKILKESLDSFRESIKFFSQEKHQEFYQIFRLILPKLDRGRKSYNMKENRIARTIIKMFTLANGPDKNKLLNSTYFSDTVQLILRKYIPNDTPVVSVSEINQHLDLIANRDSDSVLDDLMLQAFKKLTPQESKWLVRIILKELHLGLDNNKILNLFHQDASKFYSSNTSLIKVCETLWHPSIHLHEISTKLFEHFQPMLSKRCGANSFNRDIPESKVFIVETKFDGERFQLHMENGKFKYFSRNGFDFTKEYGENFSVGSLTPKLKHIFNENVKKVILDGEMMLWNSNCRKFGSKGMKFDVKKLKDSHHYQPCFCVFDILQLNDDVLTNKELTFRLKTLKKVITEPIEGVLVVSKHQEANSRQKIIDELNEVADNEGEGIVIKDPKSVYKFGDRKSGWYKLKLEYFEDTVTDLDVILMGGYHKTASFLVGVYSGGGDTVLSMGRVSSKKSLVHDFVNEKLREKGRSTADFNSKKLMFGKDIPDVYIEPEHSIIFTIRATELIRSNNDFRTPYTHRFPRILCVREDKSYKDCLSINELLDICHQNKSVIKLNKRHLELEDIKSSRPRKQIKTLDINVESLTKINNSLKDLKFHVASGLDNLSVHKIEEMIGKCGGTIRLNLDENVNIVIVGNVTKTVEKLLKKVNNYDVIKVDWLKRIVDSNELQKYKQNEVLKISLKFFNSLADDVDKYGDSYFEELNVESLRMRLERMAENPHILNVNNSVHFRAGPALFRKNKAYFDRFEEINNPNSRCIYDSFLDEIEFKYRKGRTSEKLNQEVDLVITNESSDARIILLQNYAKNINCDNIKIIHKDRLYDVDM